STTIIIYTFVMKKENRRRTHCGQSRALLLRCVGHVQSYTPSAAHTQNTTLTHTASADANVRFAFRHKYGRRMQMCVLRFVTNTDACTFHQNQNSIKYTNFCCEEREPAAAPF
ncbi:MAG: hypothetical protein IJC21_06735, partial [Lentisphaeria bacterium]|nr:hypothetical protein [Lentisphaeria bacterium]